MNQSFIDPKGRGSIRETQKLKKLEGKRRIAPQIRNPKKPEICLISEKTDTSRSYSQHFVSLAQHKDCKQRETASLTLCKGNKTHLLAPVKLTDLTC